jgi:hypothetical protein
MYINRSYARAVRTCFKDDSFWSTALAVRNYIISGRSAHTVLHGTTTRKAGTRIPCVETPPPRFRVL